MSRASVRARLPLRILTAALGTGLFAYLVWRAGPSKLIADVVALRWGVVLIIVLAALDLYADHFIGIAYAILLCLQALVQVKRLNHLMKRFSLPCGFIKIELSLE